MRRDEKQALGEAALFLALWPLAVLLCAKVFSSLWLWFLTPLGVPPIGLAHAYGILCLLAFTKTTYTGEDKRSTSEKILGPLVAALLVWGLGAVAHGLMT